MVNPRAVIEVDGADVRWTDILNIKVENTLYLAADSFECSLNNEGTDSGNQKKFLSDWLRKDQEVRIYMGYVSNPQTWTKAELKHIFTGRIDGVKTSFNNSNTVQIIGRDYSAAMIDSECTIAYKNVTSSDIASIIAAKHKLKPNIARTTGIIEKELLEKKKEWEILQLLADLEGFVCYVTKDKELCFGERKDKDETEIDTFYYSSGSKSNCRIEFDDSSIGVINKVVARHWHHNKKKLIEAFSQNDALIKSMGQTKERVIYNSKLNTYAAAKQYADKKLKEYSRLAVTASGSRTPGNQELYAECKIKISGCGRFDGIYYMDKVTHSLNKQSGYVNEFEITNIRPENTFQYKDSLYS